MKKLITICLLITASYSVKAQTLEQTMDYINVNLQNYLFNKQYTQVFAKGIDVTTTLRMDHTTRWEFTRLFMANIKSVDYVINNDGFVIITATGKCYVFEDEKPIYDKVAPQSITFFLQKSTPIDNVKRIIKAMKHAAELEGAKLINDDLFKN
jgi:hypothetical protein